MPLETNDKDNVLTVSPTHLMTCWIKTRTLMTIMILIIVLVKGLLALDFDSSLLPLNSEKVWVFKETLYMYRIVWKTKNGMSRAAGYEGELRIVCVARVELSVESYSCRVSYWKLMVSFLAPTRSSGSTSVRVCVCLSICVWLWWILHSILMLLHSILEQSKSSLRAVLEQP